MEKRPNWLGGSIRRKLTLFVGVILLLILGIFWFCTVFLLQPAYQRSITEGLDGLLSTIVGILDDVKEKEGTVYVTVVGPDGSLHTQLTESAVERLDAAMQAGTIDLSGRCVDIAGADLRALWVADNLKPRCLLHPSYETGITAAGVDMVSDYNSDLVTLARRAVLSRPTGEKYIKGGTDADDDTRGLYIMGMAAAGGEVSVIVTANLERIPQAQRVLQELMLPLSMLLALVSTTAAWLFSRWFTRPLSRLSHATKEMARGNYNVRVDDCGEDEFGQLGRDFNAMAYEVGRSAELQRDLMANVSHDLRTPLTLIKGYAETVRDLTGDNPLKRTEQMNVIVDESDRLTTLVGKVMELSKMSSGVDRPEPVRFDLYDLGDELAYRYEEICRQRGGTFLYSGEEGCNVYADPGLIERALHNLLGNAMHHMGDDGFVGLKVYRRQAEENGHRQGTMVRCEVSDHGPGISEQDLPYIFERYYRSRADNGKPGTGLGLSITKLIFESQGIRYGVLTELGKGSTFWFELPLSELPPLGAP